MRRFNGLMNTKCLAHSWNSVTHTPHHHYMDTCLKSQMSEAFILFLPYLANLLKTQASLQNPEFPPLININKPTQSPSANTRSRREPGSR